MPTIHLSLPEGIYRELKRYSESLGVQMTDLVKFMINKGLDELREKYGYNKDEEIVNTLNVIMHSIENIERKITLLELRIKENEIKMKEFMDSVDNRISDMELTLQELQEPVIEPEFIEAKPRRTRKIRTRQI